MVLTRVLTSVGIFHRTPRRRVGIYCSYFTPHGLPTLGSRREKTVTLRSLLGFALLVTGVGEGCGKSPSAPTPASLNGSWSGAASDSSSNVTWTWTITTSGGGVSGTFIHPGSRTCGFLEGTLSGSTLTFKATVVSQTVLPPPPAGSGGSVTLFCPTYSGSASVSTTQISATYSGTTCNNTPITNGRVVLTRLNTAAPSCTPRQ
jgi:hypothetical protein